MKSIGQSFSDELQAAGLLGLPFSWGSDGNIQFDERMTQDQIDAVNAVYAAHDPNKTVDDTPPDPLSDLIVTLINNGVLPNDGTLPTSISNMATVKTAVANKLAVKS